MLHKLVVLLHLFGFVGYLGAGVVQQWFLARSTGEGVLGPVRDEFERLAASVTTNLEVPALFLQIVSGSVILLLAPIWLHQGWLQAKLALVGVLLVIGHVEMFGARGIVKARSAGAPEPEIAARKRRHLRLGLLDTAIVIAIVVLVALGIG